MATPTPEALEAILAKLCRAAKHADEFMVSYTDWHHGPTYRPVSDLKPHPTKPGISKGEWRVELLTPPPLADWAALTGEILYQLRSTLEHLAYLIASRDRHPHAPPRGTGFPIELKEARFDGSGKVAGMSDTARALLKELQPFDPRWNDDPRLHPLWLLQELSDTDRHATPHLAASLARLGRIEVGELHNAEILAFRPHEGPFENRAVVATGTVRWLDPNNAEVKMHLDLAPHIAFAIPGPTAHKPYAGRPVLRTLADIHWYVIRDVFLGRLAPYLFPERFDSHTLTPAEIRPPWIVYE